MNVVVLGMHRSGTSLLIGLLEVHGFQLGEVSNQTSVLKPTGTKENLAIRALNNQLLKAADSDWLNPQIPQKLSKSLAYKIEDQAEKILKITNWALKDPRMVFTYPIWCNYLEDHKIIGTIREPLGVAISLHKKNGIEIEEGMEIWYRYNKQLLSLWQKHRFPLVVFCVAKESYLDQIKSIFKYLGIQFDYQKAVEFYQHKNTVLKASVNVPTHIQDLHEELLSLAYA